MLVFIPRSLCALKRVAAKNEHARFGATQGIRISVKKGLYRAEATDGRRAIFAQGIVDNDVPWPGFRDTPDDAFEIVIPPKDLERACKTAETSLGPHSSVPSLVGVATMGAKVILGLGNDVMSTEAIDGRFPDTRTCVPATRPMFTVRVDPKLLAETLLAMADMLPLHASGVQLFFYGNDKPIGVCARNIDTGMMIDGLVVPLIGAAPAEETAKATAKAQSNGKAKDAPDQEKPADSPEPAAVPQPSANPEPGPVQVDSKPGKASRNSKSKK
jgi:hypothetical protein